jgi:hypothetical protein
MVEIKRNMTQKHPHFIFKYLGLRGDMGRTVKRVPSGSPVLLSCSSRYFLLPDCVGYCGLGEGVYHLVWPTSISNKGQIRSRHSRWVIRDQALRDASEEFLGCLSFFRRISVILGLKINIRHAMCEEKFGGRIKGNRILEIV